MFSGRPVGSRFEALQKGPVCAGNGNRGAGALPAYVCPGRSRNDPGTVLDQTGGAIAGAMVTITDVARGVTRTLTTDDAGEYLANNLTPGTYTVRATAKGFRNVEHSGVLVQVSENIRVDLVVQPGEQTQTITVNGEVPAIDTTDSTLGGAVSNSEINSLPLNGRNFQRLLELRPGVVYVTQGGRSGSSSTNGLRTGATWCWSRAFPRSTRRLAAARSIPPLRPAEKIPPLSCPSMPSRSSPACRIPRRSMDSRTARSSAWG